MQGLQYPLGYQIYYHGDTNKGKQPALVDTQYNSSSDSDRDSPPPLPPGEENVTPQTGSSTSLTSSSRWLQQQTTIDSHDPDSMDLDNSDYEDNPIQTSGGDVGYTTATPQGNQYTSTNSQYGAGYGNYVAQYTTQDSNRYTQANQYTTQHTNQYSTGQYTKDTNQYTTRDTNQYTVQDTSQYATQDSSQCNTQDTSQGSTGHYSTKDNNQQSQYTNQYPPEDNQDTSQYTNQSSTITSQPVLYGSHSQLPQQQGWVGQWQPSPSQQWAGQGYHGNEWNNYYYQQYYQQQSTVQEPRPQAVQKEPAQQTTHKQPLAPMPQSQHSKPLLPTPTAVDSHTPQQW